MDFLGIGSIVGGLLGFKGTKDTNRANKEIAAESNAMSQANAREQMAFQASQSATAYQRAIADMSKAGLNPMLAYQQGGASTPSGAAGAISSPKMENALGAGVSSAMQAAGVVANIQNTKSATSLNDAMAVKASADTLNSMNSAEASRFEIDRMLGLKEYRYKTETRVAEDDAYRSAQDRDARGAGAPAGDPENNEGYRAARADLQRRIAEGFLTQADVPRARAERDFYEGGGKYMPYVNALGEFAGSALGLKRLLGGDRPRLRR